MRIETTKTSFKTDLHTPISLFLRIRNRFRKPMLLESNDYHSRTESSSIIGFEPLVEIIVDLSSISIVLKEGAKKIELSENDNVDFILARIMADFKPQNDEKSVGFFSYFGFEFSHLNERQVISTGNDQRLPLAHLILYKYIITIDHFHDTGEFIVNQDLNEDSTNITLEEILQFQPNAVLPFEVVGNELSELKDEDFLKFVALAKEHILRGDVFQLVLSREFNTSYFGDDFQVYRELRILNPSPYLFYADYETHRIIGSSPEKQLQIKEGIAEIHPIAGTVRKSGNTEQDKTSMEALIADEKENAEHTMLVDLARNDLSKYCTDVKVTHYKEIQHFSHVIHLVSKVIGATSHSPFQLFSGTFPAGTLSGTPKPKALELIEKYEPGKRDYYGGALGFIGFNGNINLAIIIRSILSQNNTLSYRAGAGIVLDSIPQNELQEVTNKLGAVRKAIEAANCAEQFKENAIV